MHNIIKNSSEKNSGVLNKSRSLYYTLYIYYLLYLASQKANIQKNIGDKNNNQSPNHADFPNFFANFILTIIANTTDKIMEFG